MPIIIPKDLPAYQKLEDEFVMVMTEQRAVTQDIRPLRVAIVNLMPTKVVTETQLARILANTPLQVELDLVSMGSHTTKNTPASHMDAFYKPFEEIKNHRYDAMIITGAPVENLEFEDVDYWDELEELMEYSKKNVFSTMHLCWGAQAGLYHHFGIRKYDLPEKMFGVFKHKLLTRKTNLVKGFDDEFYAPHSRHTEVRAEDIEKVPELRIIATSPEAGVHLVATMDDRQVFVQGHGEYDRETLYNEYIRDKNKGLDIHVPYNYFEDDDPEKPIIVRWRAATYMFFENWLNFVYQETPYDLNDL
ncbi:MAG: homoserine O-succinyltransferase [Clostridiales bacterium]|nr:homoserine O-succinyltransferase [Clostridiales bacterium]